MSITVAQKYGDSVIHSQAPSLKEALRGLAEVNEFPKKCGKCASANIHLRHRSARDYDFYEVECQDCKHTYSLGQTKEGDRLFPKRDEGWKPPYEGKGGGESGSSAADAGEDDDF